VSDQIHLNGHHRATVDELFRHPLGHNVEWHDVLSLLEKVGTVETEHNGRLLVTVGSESVVLDEPRRRDLDTQQVLDMRRLLKAGGITPEHVAKSHPE